MPRPASAARELAPTSITVTVQGTGITATVSSGESFTLNGVPTGNIVLQFSGAVTGQFTIPAVQNQEQIRVAVSFSESSLTLTITQRTKPTNSEAQVEGPVTSLNATARTLVVDGVTVSVPTTTIIRAGEGRTLGFSDLKNGERVQVTGTFSGSMLVASKISVRDEQSDE
jgi:hypothetical protein